MCGQVVVAARGLDEAMSRHLDAGCPSTELRAPLCAVALCRSAKDVLRMRCADCGKVTCVAHRAPDLHACNTLLASSNVTTTTTTVAAPSAASRVGNRVRALMASLQKKKKPANNMVMRQQALGDAKIPPESRFYAEVHFGLGTGKVNLVFLNKAFSVGKAIDVLATLGKVPNNNDKPGMPKLHLFNLETGEQLANLTLLRDLPSGSLVLLLDTEASVFEQS